MGTAAVWEDLGLIAMQLLSDSYSQIPPGYWRWHVCKELRSQHGKPRSAEDLILNWTPARDESGLVGVADRLVVPTKPGNAGGGKGPELKEDVGSGKGPGDWR